MRIERLLVQNYRSVEKIELAFPTHYTAICGRNDSGKTSLLRAIRALIGEEGGPYYWGNDVRVSFKDDHPKWHAKDLRDRLITISGEFIVQPDRDTGLYEFLITYLSLPQKPPQLDITVSIAYSAQQPAGEVTLSVGGTVHDTLKAEEVLKRLRSSHSVLFHNSTESIFPARYLRQFSGFLEGFSQAGNEKLDAAMKTLNRAINKTAKFHQREVESLLGRLEDKYRVNLSFPEIKPDSMPFSITLGDKNFDIDLVDWGSGTRNRTLILLTLFRARKISQSAASSSKLAPIIIIEEPESFLHPSAQAEFGSVIQSVAQEFEIQVLVATHSPFMLSREKPEANVLLERRLDRGKVRESVVVPTNASEWMKPFGLALGIDSDDLRPWYNLFFNTDECVLLVEGDTDKEYFELLRDTELGKNALRFAGQIFAYNGVDNLTNTALLNYMRGKHRKLAVTYDLDCEERALKALSRASIERNKSAFAVGLSVPGKRNIEGLLPDRVVAKVHSDNIQCVQQATAEAGADGRSAKNRLKKLYLETLKAEAQRDRSALEAFFPLVNKLNKALSVDGN